MSNNTVSEPITQFDFDTFKSQVLEDFKLAVISRDRTTGTPEVIR